MKEYDGVPYCEFWKCLMDRGRKERCSPSAACWGKAELCKKQGD